MPPVEENQKVQRQSTVQVDHEALSNYQMMKSPDIIVPTTVKQSTNLHTLAESDTLDTCVGNQPKLPSRQERKETVASDSSHRRNSHSSSNYSSQSDDDSDDDGYDSSDVDSISSKSSHTFSATDSTNSESLRFRTIFPWNEENYTSRRGGKFVSSCGCSFSDSSHLSGGCSSGEDFDDDDDDYLPPTSIPTSRRGSSHHCVEYSSVYKRKCKPQLPPPVTRSQSIDDFRSFRRPSLDTTKRKQPSFDGKKRCSAIGYGEKGKSPAVRAAKNRKDNRFGVRRLITLWKDSGFFGSQKLEESTVEQEAKEMPAVASSSSAINRSMTARKEKQKMSKA